MMINRTPIFGNTPTYSAYQSGTSLQFVQRYIVEEPIVVTRYSTGIIDHPPSVLSHGSHRRLNSSLLSEESLEKCHSITVKHFRFMSLEQQPCGGTYRVVLSKLNRDCNQSLEKLLSDIVLYGLKGMCGLISQYISKGQQLSFSYVIR